MWPQLHGRGVGGVEREGSAYQAANATSSGLHCKWFESFLAFSYMSCSEEDNNEAKLAETVAKDSGVSITQIFVQIPVPTLMSCVILGKVF